MKNKEIVRELSQLEARRIDSAKRVRGLEKD